MATVRVALEALVAWSEKARRAVVDAIEQSGGSPLVWVEVPVVELKDPEGKGLRYHAPPRPLSTLKAGGSLGRYADRIAWPDPQALREAAAYVYGLIGASAEYWCPYQPEMPAFIVGPVEFATDPVEWIFACVLIPVFREYVSSLEDPRVAEPARLAAMLDQTAAFLVSDHFIVEERAAVSGLIADAPLAKDGVALRTATAEEMGEWSDVRPMVRAHRGMRRCNVTLGQIPTHVLSLQHRASKMKQPRHPSGVHPLLLAIQLLGFRAGSPGPLMTELLPEWANSGTMFFPLVAPDAGKPKPFTQADLEEAIELAARIPPGAVGEPRGRPEIALHRFRAALEREQPVDVLLDAVVALEAILLVDTSGELSYRFAVRGSRWLAATPADRKTIYDELHAVYSLRSKVVHGLRYPDRALIATNADLAITLAQRVLVKGLRDGWLGGPEFDLLVLS